MARCLRMHNVYKMYDRSTNVDVFLSRALPETPRKLALNNNDL